MVVEDDPVFRRFVLAAVAEGGRATNRPTVASAVTSIAEAKAALAAGRPDCILLDLGLPDSQGLDSLESILHAAPAVPVVVLTGAEEDELVDQALLAGAQDFLEKAQLKPDSLARSLRHALDRAAWAAQLNAKNRELEDRNRALDDFAHAVSHDLKAPLRAIFHAVAQAEEELATRDPEAAARTLASAEPRIRRLFGMIDGLLRITMAGRRSNAVPVDLGSVVREVLDSLALPPGFQVVVAPDLPIVTGTRAELAQVFQNLLDNAVKHHPGPTGRIELGCTETAQAYELTVRDDGAGIPAGQRELVFQLFHTVPGRDTTDSSGIGLALVRKVVEAHGGTIAAEDNAPRGTCFRIRWPRHAPA